VEPEIKCSFDVVGDERFDPNDFTGATGLTPSDTYRKGDVWRGRVRRDSRWRLVIGPERSFDHADQVNRLLNAVEPKAEAISAFRRHADVELWIELWWPGTDEGLSNPSLYFPPELIQRIAHLGAGVDIDV
jgi:hypothetical protein